MIAAVAIVDDRHRMLTVRKRGTSRFMNPGGKLEPGESGLDAAVREIHEELGLALDPLELHPLGVWTAPAANEPGWSVEADAFWTRLPAGAEPVVQAEIEELRWVSLDEITELINLAPDGVPGEFAPLLLTHFVPALLAQMRSTSPIPVERRASMSP